jgi:SAM-dependent methyltransferase
MPHTLLRSLAAIGIALIAACSAVLAQAPAQEFVPEVGQDGKDVVWVPTAQTLVEKMLDMADVKSGDYLIDLGSGDGRTVIAAAKRGAKALGIEYNPRMVELAKRNAVREGVADRASFVEGDIFRSDFSKASVLTLFLLPEINLQLMPLILNMKPGTRVVSNSFEMGSWKPDATAEVARDCKTYCKALLWIVPARVEGDWQLVLAGENLAPDYLLRLEQIRQTVSGALVGGTHAVVPVTGRLKGNEITFTDTDEPHKVEFKGEVTGDSMEGSSTTLGKPSWRWTATRKKGP